MSSSGFSQLLISINRVTVTFPAFMNRIQNGKDFNIIIIIIIIIIAIELSLGGSSHYTGTYKTNYIYIYLLIYCNWVVTRWQ